MARTTRAAKARKPSAVKAPARAPASRTSSRTRSRTSAAASKARPAAGARGIRNFDAAGRGRRLKAVPTARTAINDQIRNFGSTVLARSRYLGANNVYVGNAREIWVSAAVGDGIKPTTALAGEQRRLVQEAWRDWTDQSDADGLLDFYGQQALLAGEHFEAGEVFVRFMEVDDPHFFGVPLQIQILPAEMVPLEKNESLPGGNYIECGIEFDTRGRRVAYWVHPQHPATGAIRVVDNTPQRIPADEMLHLFRPTRAGQIRGLPHTLPAVTRTAIHDNYEDAELERKRTAALRATFVTSPEVDPGAGNSPYGDPDDDSEEDTWSVEPGATYFLKPGEDIANSNPADVGPNYEAFQYRTLLGMAAGMGTPYAAMTGDLRQANYGSIRAGLIEYRRRVRAFQNHVLIFQFCRAVWARWLRLAVIHGAVPIRPSEFERAPMAYLRASWKPPRWDWIDPWKDLQAEKLAVDNGYKARSDVIDEMGEDAEDVDARIFNDRERERRLQLAFPIAGAPGSPVRSPPRVDDDEDEDAEQPSEQDDTHADPPEEEARRPRNRKAAAPDAKRRTTARKHRSGKRKGESLVHV